MFRYDFGDSIGMPPLLPMYTHGHNFNPAPIQVGGLRYHGTGVIASQLLKDKLNKQSLGPFNLTGSSDFTSSLTFLLIPKTTQIQQIH